MTTSQDAPLQAWTETVETLLVGTARRVLPHLEKLVTDGRGILLKLDGGF